MKIRDGHSGTIMNPSSPADPFNDMIVDIDMNLFNIQMKLARFVAALLDETGGVSEIDSVISLQAGEGYRTARCTRISLDAETETICLISSDGREKIAWDDTDIAARYLIAQDLYTRRLSDGLYRGL
jgi:hypothetical protein